MNKPLKYILITFFLIIVIGGGYFVCQKMNSSGKIVLGWKTYENQKYNYEVRYPLNWYVYDYDNGKTILAGTTFSPFNEGRLIDKGGASLNILPLGLSSTTLREFVEKRISLWKIGNQNLEVELTEVSLNGTSAFKAETKNDIIAGGIITENPIGPAGEGVTYWLEKDNQRFEIGFVYPISDEENLQAIFSRMISTFRFTK